MVTDLPIPYIQNQVVNSRPQIVLSRTKFRSAERLVCQPYREPASVVRLCCIKRSNRQASTIDSDGVSNVTVIQNLSGVSDDKLAASVITVDLHDTTQMFNLIKG